MNVQPKFATEQELIKALNIRQWHLERVLRFFANKGRKGEDIQDIVRSLKLHDTLTEVIGDGLFIRIPHNKLWVLKASGYERKV